MTKKKCPICDKEVIKRGNKYCCKECYSEAQRRKLYPQCGFRNGHGFIGGGVEKGRHLSPKTEFKKGRSNPFKNKEQPSIKGEKNGFWKGDEVGYFALHNWVRRNYGIPTKCEECGKEIESGKGIQWANVSGEYKRDRDDWEALCVRCHVMKDGTINNLKCRQALSDFTKLL